MAKTSSWIFGVIFVVAGIWGFFAQPALGFIAADLISSIIHLVVGIVLIALASRPQAGTAFRAVGIVYVLWSLLGFLGWNFTITDGVTNWFYLVVGLVISILGWAWKGSSAPIASAPMSSGTPQM